MRSLLAASLLCSVSFAQDVPVAHLSEILPPDGGRQVAADGNVVVTGGFGFEVDEVEVYEHSRAGWGLTAVLQPDASSTPVVFGDAVAVDGDTIAVGGFGDLPGLGTKCIAWIYVRSGGQWTFEGHAWIDTIGGFYSDVRRLSLDGDRLLMLESGGSVAETWTRQNGTWSSEQVFTTAHFGQGLGLDGDRLVIDTSAGAEVHRLSGSTWSQEDVLPDEAWLDIGGGRIAIGKWGEVRIYEFVGGTWTLTQRLTDPHTAWGLKVDLEGPLLLVGNDVNPGMFLYWHNGMEFVEVGHLGAELDLGYGKSIALTETTAVCGTSGGPALYSIGADVGTRYCQAGVNSLGQKAHVHAFGSAVAAEDGLELAIEGGIPNAFAIPIFSATWDFQPLGNGVLCIGSPIRLPIVQLNPYGSGYQWIDLVNDPGWSQITNLVPIAIHFQFWYRDGSLSNLTDAVFVEFK